MSTARDYQAWLVDLDGTLYHPLPVKVAMASELLLRRGPVRVLRTFRHVHEQLRERGTLGRAPWTAQIEETANKLGMGADEVESTVRDWMIERPCKWIGYARRERVILRLQQLVKKGAKLALVSDYPADEKLKELGLESFFDVVVASGQAHSPTALKPDPEGYLMAARLLDVGVERCTVLGDRDDADGLAAKRAGMGYVNVRDFG